MDDPLKKYIKECKSKNISNEEIIKNLTSKGWPIEKINQALIQLSTTQIPQNPTPIEPVPAKVLDQTTSLANNDSPPEKKPKVINVISIIVFLIASLYFFKIFSFIGIIAVMGKSFSGGDLAAISIVKYFPAFGMLLILFCLIAIASFYIAFTIRNGSKKSYIQSLLFLLIVPTLSSIIVVMSMSSILKFTSGNNTTTSLTNPSVLNFGDPIFILNIISVILLVFSYKKFHFNNDYLSKKVKNFLILLALIIIIPTGLVIYSDYSKSFDTDYGFTLAKEQTTYHIYKPILLPGNLSYATKFSVGKELAGKQNAVKVAFDIPFDKIIKGEETKPIVITQVGIDAGFNFDEFASTYTKDVVPQKTQLPKAVNQNGYILQKKLGNTTLSYLVFVTSDNVLISIASNKATSEELINLSNTLQ